MIGTRPITVTPGIQTTLEAPASVAARFRFKVIWTGPNGKGDAVYLVPAGSRDELTPGLTFKRTIAGNTLNFVAPSVPGRYELRYVYQTSKPPKVLARNPLQVR